MSDKKIIEMLDKIDKRLIRLEKLVAPDSTISPQTTTKSQEKIKDYKGITGGIRYLIDNRFFEKPKSMREIFDELKKEGYFYPIQSVDGSIRKDFFIRKKTLLRIKAGKIWKYVVRK